MANLPLPPVEYLRQCFDYDEVTGVLTWRARPESHFKNAQICAAMNTRAAGKIAGCVNMTGYSQVKINLRNYIVHRVVWALHNGVDVPAGMEVDHIDGDKANNRASNLRLATHPQNCRNMRKPLTGANALKGVKFSRKRKSRPYEGRIICDGVYFHLGCFDTAEEAHAAYCKAAKELHGEFARTF